MSDLTKGVEVFNGKNIFKNCWKRSSSEEIVTELKISDFNGSGELWNGSKAEQYTNGCVLYPKFSDEPLKKEGKYYIILDGFAGKVMERMKLRLSRLRTNLTVWICQNIQQKEAAVISADGDTMDSR